MATRRKGPKANRRSVGANAKTKKLTPTNHEVVCQEWEESERGWGVRPDGYTLHLSHADRINFVQQFYAENNNDTEVPDEYTRVSGDPFLVEVGPDTYQSIVKAKEKGALGIWGEGNVFPSKNAVVIPEKRVIRSDLP